MLKRFVLCGLFGALAACSGGQSGAQGQAAQPATAAAEAPAVRLNALVEEYWQRFLQLNPVYATIVGDNRYNDRMEINIAPQYLADSLALDKEYLERLQAIDPSQLSGQSRLTYDTFRLDRELAIEGYHFPSELIPINQSFSVPLLIARMGSPGGLTPFLTVKDYDNWLNRVHGFTQWVDQAIANMREGAGKGVVQPRALMQKVLPQLAAVAVDDPKQSLFYAPITQMPASFSAQDRERLTSAYTKLIKEEITPAYRRLHDYIRDDYLQKTRASVALSALPNGEAWYAYQVKLQTTTAMTPEETHQLGLKEVERIRGEMEKVIAQVGFKGDIKAFFASLRSDPRFYYSKPEDLLNGYRALKDQVNAEVPKLFAIQPKADFEIRPVEEFRARSAAGASYQGATPDGSRPGVFYVNTFDLKSRPRYSMQCIYLHEAVPGHHFQISIQQELKDLPSFRRFGGYTAYVEGWGLYAESLGRDLGLYQDPYDYFGALGGEIFRAARLVVDTGMHAKGWTREQAIEYMSANTALGPTDVESEIERYIAVPGQALSYKVGQLKITALRERAQKALGPRFDIREFHSQILTDGALPLDVLDAKIDRWIAAGKK